MMQPHSAWIRPTRSPSTPHSTPPRSMPTICPLKIICLRYGIGDGYTYTLEEVGRRFNVTRERVRQIEAKAIKKLQHPIRSRKLEGFIDTKTY